MRQPATVHFVGTLRTLLVALVAVASVAALGGVAAADGPKESAVTSVVEDGQVWHLKVYSAAMNSEISVDVQRPVDQSKPAPNLYLLSGLDAGLGTANWRDQTTVLAGLAHKQVNVIQPIGGKGSYYADWVKPDPKLGVNKWQTFFTEELPPLLDQTLHSTGLNALAGVSTSGTSVLHLAEVAPGLWKSVAAYSGCAQIADPMGRRFLSLAVETWAGGDLNNMYGPPDSPVWAANDPVVNAEKLRGTPLYISSGSGLAVSADVDWYEHDAPGPQGMVNLIVGMAIEAGTDACTNNLKAKLDSLGIPATFDFNSVGTHRWKYWEDTFWQSWPMLAHSMEIAE